MTTAREKLYEEVVAMVVREAPGGKDWLVWWQRLSLNETGGRLALLPPGEASPEIAAAIAAASDERDARPRAEVEAEVRELLPGAKLVRMDQDTTRRRASHGELLERFASGDVLIGTQMIAKGLDFPRLSLVGVILADLMLAQPGGTAPSGRR